MGEAKSWRRRFFGQHPFCCFCGGTTRATTVDHQPGRVFFRDRQWPEGFAFPACEHCNSISKTSERVLAVLVHGHADGSDDATRAAYRANLESVRREFPDEISNLIPSRREVREFFKDKKLARPAGLSLSEIPMVKFGGPFWNFHLEMFARKLLLALHYQCFGKVLPSSGGAWAWIHTNANFMVGEFPQEIMDLAKNIALPVRSRKYLHEQFSVRWAVAADSPTAIFVAQLQKLLVISGITTEEPLRFGDLGEILRPFGPI